MRLRFAPTAIVASIVLLLLAVPAAAQEFNSQPWVAIPDADVNGVSDQIVVAGGPASINSLRVMIYLQHSRTSDVTVTLTSPGNDVVTLVAGEGGNGDSFRSTWFTSSTDPSLTATEGSIIGAAAPFNGVFTPEDTAGFDGLYGTSANGTWTLTVIDDVAGDNNAAAAKLFLHWTIEFDAPESFFYHRVPLMLIPDFDGIAVVPASDIINVTGAPTNIESVRIRFWVANAWGADQLITLQPPSGNLITLSDRNGNGLHYFNTGFTSTADAVFTPTNGAISAGTPPFNGVYTSDDTADFDAQYGANANGNWTITFADDWELDEGVLLDWSIEFRTPAVAGPSIDSPAAGALPFGEVGTAYSVTVTASGGVTPYVWSISNGSLPGGLSIDPGTGEIAGTPDTTGSFTFDVTVTDDNSRTDTRTYSIDVFDPLAITFPAAGALGGGTVGVPYGPVNFTASGGATPYTWSFTGSLPTGLTLTAGGVLSGTPTANGTYNFNVTVTDNNGTQDTRAYSIDIADTVRITSPAAGPLTAAYVGEAFPGVTFTATGGATPYQWTGTSLPPGLSIDINSGQLTGTPSATGSYSFTIQVEDAGNDTDTRNYTIDVVDTPSITSPANGSSLEEGTEGRPGYANTAVTFTASGGVAPLTWGATGLPTGLSINTSTSEITGTPATAGSYNITVTVQDANARQDSRNYTIVINAPVSIDTTALPDGREGTIYSETPAFSGGTAGYTWSMVITPQLKALSMDAATGQITGTPALGDLGTYSVQITVTDSYGSTDVATVSLEILTGTGSLSTGGGGCSCSGSTPGSARSNNVQLLWCLLVLLTLALIRRRLLA